MAMQYVALSVFGRLTIELDGRSELKKGNVAVGINYGGDSYSRSGGGSERRRDVDSRSLRLTTFSFFLKKSNRFFGQNHIA